MKKRLALVTINLLLLTVAFGVYKGVRSHRKQNSFGGASISQELYSFIREQLPEGGTLLELGSGWGTGQLAQYFSVTSVEHNPKWVGRYASNYIYAPIRDGWYDVNVLKERLPTDYQLLLVDGPPGTIGRDGFLNHLDLFHTDIPIIFDDIGREEEYQLMVQVAEALDRPFHVVDQATKPGAFGIIYPDAHPQ